MTATARDTEDVRAIKQLIQAFFDSINEADPKSMQTRFFPGANLTIIRQGPPRDPESSTSQAPSSSRDANEPADSKLTVVMRTTIEKFVALLEKRPQGQPGPVVHEVPDLAATDVKIDSLFATAWSPFTVTFDGKLHHYGFMAFTFGKTDVGAGAAAKEWRIEGLTQDYKRALGWESEGHGAQPEFSV